MRFGCVNKCRGTWFGYMAKGLMEARVEENNVTISTIVYSFEQSKAAICMKCYDDASQIYEKCKDCGSYKEFLTKELCPSCVNMRLTK